MIDPIAHILLLARFLCFMAVVYLVLHKMTARLRKKPNSKLLWFFSVVTGPLTRPVSGFSAQGTSQEQLLSRSLVFYGLLWLLFIALGRMAGLPE